MRPRLEVDDDAIRIVGSEPATRFVAYAPEPGLPLSRRDWESLRECMAAGPELADVLELIVDEMTRPIKPVDGIFAVERILADPAVVALLHRIK